MPCVGFFFFWAACGRLMDSKVQMPLLRRCSPAGVPCKSSLTAARVFGFNYAGGNLRRGGIVSGLCVW